MTKRPTAPKITPLTLPSLATGDVSQINDDELVEMQRFEGIEQDLVALSSITFERCELSRFTTEKIDLRYARLLETRIEHLGAPVCEARGTVWRGSELRSSRLGAVEMFDSGLSDTIIEGSKIGLFNLHSAQLTDVLIRDCHIEELVLDNASLTRVQFEGTTVEKLCIRGAESRDVDLRGATMRMIDGFESLRGMTISSQQSLEMAHLFARHLGVTVVER